MIPPKVFKLRKWRIFVVLTNFFEHLVALVENEDLEVGEVEVALLDKSEDSPGGANDDVGLLETLEEGDVLLDGDTSEDDFGSDVRGVLEEADEFFVDLIGKLSVVAQDHGRDGLGVLRKLLEGGEDEDSSLSHAGLCLAENVDSHHGVGDAFLLDLRGVLETTVGDCAVEFGLEKHVLEAGGGLSKSAGCNALPKGEGI